MMYAKIYNAEGKLVRVYDGSREGAELNTPAGGRIEEIPPEVFNDQERISAMFREES